MQSIVVHIANEESISCEVEELPSPTDQSIRVFNPRKRDGLDLHYVLENVTSLIVPLHRITFIQIMPSSTTEDIIGFVRE
jgi:hypothetical protein